MVEIERITCLAMLRNCKESQSTFDTPFRPLILLEKYALNISENVNKIKARPIQVSELKITY
jgi:glycerol-3-phosphate responsive antiterminator